MGKRRTSKPHTKVLAQRVSPGRAAAIIRNGLRDDLFLIRSYAIAARMTGLTRTFPPLWRVEKTPSGFRVLDALGSALAFVYANDDLASKAGFDHALTTDEARRIATGIARLPEMLAANTGISSGV